MDNTQLLVDERIRARLDVSHAGNRQWKSQGSNTDLSTKAQGDTWAFVYLTDSARFVAIVRICRIGRTFGVIADYELLSITKPCSGIA